MRDPSPLSKARLEALSDGIYAVVLTLLVLDLKLPVQGELAGAALNAALLALLPKALLWLLSFWVASIFWLAQSRVLTHYAHLDRAALQIELTHLALITLLPFSTSLIGEQGDEVISALIYSAHLALLALLSLLRSLRLLRNPKLRAPAADLELVRQQIRGAAIALACTLAAVSLAFSVPGWNMLAMLGILVIGRADRLLRRART